MIIPACFNERRCCEIADCVTPLPRVSSATVISSDLMIRSNTNRRVGSARVRITVSMLVVRLMRDILVTTYALVNANVLFAAPGKR
jgi:hypothetical protein